MPKSKKWRPPWGWLLSLLGKAGGAMGAIGGAAGKVGSIMGSLGGGGGGGGAGAGAGMGASGSAPAVVSSGMKGSLLSKFGIGSGQMAGPAIAPGFAAPAPVAPAVQAPTPQVTPRQISTPSPAGFQYEGMSPKDFDATLQARGYPVDPGFDWQKAMGKAVEKRPRGGGRYVGQAVPGQSGKQVESPPMPMPNASPMARQGAGGGSLPWWYLMSRAR
jgi:hypothetical protein